MLFYWHAEGKLLTTKKTVQLQAPPAGSTYCSWLWVPPVWLVNLSAHCMCSLPQTFYVMDIVEGVQDLMRCVDFAAARGTGRTPDKVGTWEASPHFDELDVKLEEVYGVPRILLDPRNSGYDWGQDGVQLTAARNHTTIIGCARCVQVMQEQHNTVFNIWLFVPQALHVLSLKLYLFTTTVTGCGCVQS